LCIFVVLLGDRRRQRPLGRHLRGDVRSAAAIAEEPAVIAEEWPARDPAVAEAALGVLPGIDEVTERPAIDQVVGMRGPGRRRQRRIGRLQAGPADEGLDAFRRYPGNRADEMGEPQVRPHLPQPVGGGRRHVAQAVLGLAEFGDRQPLLPRPVAQHPRRQAAG
jgi:hypothetical protein